VKDKSRLEIKFVTPLYNQSNILYWLFSHPSSIKEIYKERKINNIYFDTNNLKSYHDNIDGISKRCKVRLRWYGDNLNPSSSTLEVKKRRNSYGSKCSSRMGIPINLEEISYKLLLDKLDHFLENSDVLYYNNPILINSYNRKYYTTFNQNIRITIDTNIQYFDQKFEQKPNFKKRKSSENHIVIEFKTNWCNQKSLSDFIYTFPIRAAKNSKYINGLEKYAH